MDIGHIYCTLGRAENKRKQINYMNYTENFDGIKIDVQAVDFDLNPDLQESIRKMITKLRRHVSDVNFVDVYFKKEPAHGNDFRTVSVRLGIPGNDAFATDSGNDWQGLLKSVEEKLRRQLERKKN